jgi:hypothetical protein
MTLSEIAKIYPTDKDFTHDYYNKVYEKYFSPIKEDIKLVCEIGIGGFWKEVNWLNGNSLKVWRDYFTNAQILGLDINKPTDIEDLDRIDIDWIDQSKKDLVIEYSSKLHNYDIILAQLPLLNIINNDIIITKPYNNFILKCINHITIYNFNSYTF